MINAPHDAPPRVLDTSEQPARVAQALAHGGLAGLAMWLLRDDIRAAVTRHLTGRLAVALVVAGLLSVRFANAIDFALLRYAGWAVVLLTPLFWLMARDQRLKEQVWAMEHGRDTDAFIAAQNADRERRDATAFAEDWVVNAPWRNRAAKRAAARPRFGRQT